ncbi:MAG: hypothetical protein HRF49_03420 [bacterium]|jgi:hypothetical protein
MSRRSVSSAVAFALTALVFAGAVFAQKEPAPGSKEDPIVTKGYVDSLARWSRLQVAAGGVLNVTEGTEFVLVFSQSGTAVPVEADPAKLEKVFDLTSGSVLGGAPLDLGHHYLVAASSPFTMKLGSESQLMVRNGG